MQTLVLAKSYTGIDKIVYQYLQNYIQVLAKLNISIDEIVNCIPLLVKWYTSIGNRPTRFLVLFHQYWYTVSSILVYDFIYTSIQFHLYQYTIASILVNNFINTGIPSQNVGNKDIHDLYVYIAKFEDFDIQFPK